MKLYYPTDKTARTWKSLLVDDNGMATEDLRAGDLDGDGRLDIVAAGRATKNLKIYWNRSGAK
ncbi:MAG: VCBS repeat-containing protein [Planctomycetaceae bacterium]|nr:VCBS repeat-containing protein [Planctomycetaceae bacterium]